jgi:hypothetical protein
VQIDFLATGLTVNGISLATLNGGTPEHRIEVRAVGFNSNWKAFLTAALVASLRVDAPQLFLDADGIGRTAVTPADYRAAITY